MKLLKMTIASLVMMTAAFGVYAQTIEEASEAYNAAAEKAKEKDYVAVVSLLENVISIGEKTGPDADELVREAKKMLPGMSFQAGGSLIQGGKPEEAIVYFEKAVTLAEEYEDVRTLGRAKDWVARTYVMMGGNAFNSKDYATAAEIFQKGYDVNPDNPQLALFLAQSYGEMKEYDKAYEVFRNVISLEQHGEKYAKEVNEAKGLIARYMLIHADDLKSSQPAQAVEILAESVAATPDPTAYLMLVQIANNSKNFDKVIEFGEKAAEAQTDAALKSAAYFYLGTAYDNKGNQTKAVEYYRKVTSGPNAATAKAQIAAIQAAQA